MPLVYGPWHIAGAVDSIEMACIEGVMINNVSRCSALNLDMILAPCLVMEDEDRKMLITRGKYPRHTCRSKVQYILHFCIKPWEAAI